MEDLIQVFLEESREILEQLEENLLALEKNQDDQELMASVFRAAHTIKGSAALTGLTDISSLAHRLEDILDQVRCEHKQMSQKCFQTVLKTVDMLSQMVSLAANGEQLNCQEVESMKDQLSSFIAPDEAPPNAPSNASPNGPPKQTVHPDLPCARLYKVKMRFKEDIFETGTDPIKLVTELAQKGKIIEAHTGIESVPSFAELDPYKLYLTWTIIICTDLPFSEIEQIFVFVLDDNEIVIEEVSEASASEGTEGNHTVETKTAEQRPAETTEKHPAARKTDQVNTIRVDTKRLENVLNFIAELVIGHSRVKELVCKQSNVEEEVYNAFQEVDKIIRRLQEEVMKTSMVPIGGTFTRFQRMVRDMATEQGKEVELIITGQETELDKRVIEQITDPLKHMIRNSLDHGIEMPKERVARGKPRVGRIYLNASHQEGSIIIEVSDDGQGLDLEAIHRKALQKGLVDENAKLSKAEMLRLIMQPGFSTAEKITDISGRGVGLDVVATNIQQLRGLLDLETTPGQGTKFIIKLPLTLAIIDGMMVTVGEERFIIPLTSIVEFIKARPEDIKVVEGSGRVVNMRNEYLPLASLYQILGLPADKTDPTEGILVIIRDNRKKIALLVDDILGQEQVVTKSLKENYGQVEGVAGATILGDGRVAIILDVPTLIKMMRNGRVVM